MGNKLSKHNQNHINKLSIKKRIKKQISENQNEKKGLSVVIIGTVFSENFLTAPKFVTT